jgi:putative transposase
MDEERLAGIIAYSSADFINKNKLCKCIFQWQMSCSAFSVSKKDVDHVCKYILNQPEHHKKQIYKREYDRYIKFYQKAINPK